MTLLLTVRDVDRAAVSTMLIGVGGGTGFVAELLLPRDLLLPTVPPMRLEEVDDPTGARTPEQPLETLLGVQIDVLVDLDRLAWAGLIDATGARVDATAAENPAAFPLVVDRVLKGLPYDEETVGERGRPGWGRWHGQQSPTRTPATCSPRSGASCAASTSDGRPSRSRTCGQVRPGSPSPTSRRPQRSPGNCSRSRSSSPVRPARRVWSCSGLGPPSAPRRPPG